MSALRMLAERLGRHTAVYGANGVIAFAFGLINLAVLTRFLSLKEFGELALLLLFAAGLTILYNLPVLQGGFSWVFGAGEEEAADEGDAGAGDKRRALGTALGLTTLVALVGTALVAVLAVPLAELLTGEGDRSVEIMLAGVAGALGSIWRLVSNVPRFERRPVVFVALAVARPAAVLVATISLVATGHGVRGALLGVSVGTIAAIGVALAATSRNYAVAFARSDAGPILARGKLYVPIILSFWIVQNVDLYLLSLFGTAEDVARYRVASRLGAGMSYFVSAFLIAWGPLTRTGLNEAVKRERGLAGTASLGTYFFATCMWLVVALAALSEVLIRVAPPSYAEAAPLIALVALGFVAYGAFIVLYRGSRFPNKRRWYVRLAVGTAVLFLGLGPFLVSWLGAYGAATAQMGVFVMSGLLLLRLSQRGPAPVPWEYGKLGLATAAAMILVLAHRLVDQALSAPAVLAAGVVSVLAYPAALMALGVVPRRHLSAIARTAGVSRGHDTVGSTRWLRARLAKLEPSDQHLLRLATRPRRDRTPTSAVEPDGGIAYERLVGALRRLGGVGAAGPHDEQIGKYLLSTEPVAERDARARRLWSLGADPAEVENLDSLLTRVRRLPRRMWQEPHERTAAAARAASLDVAAEPHRNAAVDPPQTIADALAGRDTDDPARNG